MEEDTAVDLPAHQVIVTKLPALFMGGFIQLNTVIIWVIGDHSKDVQLNNM